jgi:hypothetical protein
VPAAAGDGEATAYNDRLGAEWIEEFAADAVTLAGLPSPLVEVDG